LLEFVELVFAWRKRRAQLKKKSSELAGLPQRFDLSENFVGDKALQPGRENQISSRVRDSN
jgi:hypothetical protein